MDADGTSDEEDITDATDATYTLTDDDVGKKVKVKVSFTDELSGKETLTSAAYPPSGTVTATCAVPDFGTRRNIWTGTVTVEERIFGGVAVSYGFNAGDAEGGLDSHRFQRRLKPLCHRFRFRRRFCRVDIKFGLPAA